MNIWIKRSLGTLAVTGGIVLAGAATAQADDSVQESSEQSSSGSASAPISIGGLDIGTSSESSSSASSQTTVTDGDRSVSETSESSESSANDSGLSLEPISINPQAAFENESSSDSDSLGSGEVDESSSSSESSASTSAPVNIGGLSVHSENSGSSHERTEEQVTDGDRSSHEVHESSEESNDSTSFGTGAISLDPGAAFDRSSDSDRSRLGDDIDDSTSSSESDAAASLPIGFEGFSFERESASSSAEHDASTLTDGDRSVSEESASTTESEKSTSFGGGGFALAPNLSTQNARSGESSELGDELSDSSSTSSTEFDGGLPFAFDGFTGSGESAETTTERDANKVVDGDRSAAEVNQETSTTERGFDFAGGAFAGSPAFGFSSDRAAQDSEVGDLGDSESTSQTDGFLAGPFQGGAFDVATWSQDDQKRAHGELVADGDRSVETIETEQSHDKQAQDFGFDGFEGNPAVSFDDIREQMSELFTH